jgi:hypothetical protein
LLEIIWLGHFFFQSGALLGKTKSIPRDKTTIALLEIIWFGFFILKRSFVGKDEVNPSL